MAAAVSRKKKPSGRMSRGPWDASHIRKALFADGWVAYEPGPHSTLKHPDRPGKITVDQKWTGVKKGHDAWRHMVAVGGYTDKQLLELLNSV